MFKDDDSTPIDPNWVETSLCDDVLSHADKLPNDLKTVKIEDVSWFK